VTPPVETSGRRWTTSALLAFWFPLALSWTMMIVAQPLASIAISRLPEAEVQLAAYGVTFDLAFLLESPIIMLLSVSVALTRDQASYRALRRVTLWISGIMTGMFIIVAFTPVYDPILRGVMGVPSDVAAQARPALQLLLPWVGAIAWRRFHQGPLIASGLTRLVSYGTFVRLATLSAVLVAGVIWPVLSGATLGSLAISAAVVVESAINTVWALPVIRRLPERTGDTLTMRGIVRFCAPLAATDIVRTIVRPAVTAGVSRALLPALSLAAWPVSASLISAIGAPLMAFQEVTVAVINDQDSYLRVRRFVVAAGLAITLLTLLIVLTPLIDAYLSRVVDLPGVLHSHVVRGLQIMLPLPLLMAVRNLFRGVLIRWRYTAPIQLAMAVSAAVLGAALVVGVRAGWTGITVAATATLAAQIAEVVVLYPFFNEAASALARGRR
jgi:hypothetical protein